MGRIQNLLKQINPFNKKGYNGFFSSNLPESSGAWGSNQYLDANELSLYLNRAIAKRSEKVSEIEFVLRDDKGEIINKPNDLLDLLYKPNNVYPSGRQFWKLFQIYYDLIGEAYIFIERAGEFGESKKITGLHLLVPTSMKPVYGDQGKVEKYEYTTPSKTIEYKPEQILFMFNPNPKMPLRGVSLIKAGIAAISTEIDIGTYHSRILKNGGKVEGVFKFKTGPLTEQQLSDIKDRYQKEYGSAKKAGLPLFLGGDADYVKTGLSPDELGFLEAKKMTLEDICILTGVPKSMLASTSDVKFDNADADRAIFLRETIKPLLTNLTTALDEVLFPDGENLSFIDPTPENVDTKLKETESGMKNYYMTINEARARHGLDAIENGDDIMVPFNLMPLGTEPQAPTEAKRYAKSAHPLQDPEIRQMYGKVQVKRMDAREKKFKKSLKAYLDGQRDRLLDALQPTKTRVFRKENLLDETLQVGLEVKIGKELFIPVLIDLLQEAGVDAMEMAGSAFPFNVGADIASWVEQRADVFLTSINETTFRTLRDQFAESLGAGESRDKLVNRIRDTYEDISKARAQTIARTEVHNATQYGTMQGYKQGGLTIKIWVAVGDAATRDSHLAIDGEEKPIDHPFSNGLMFPGDPRGSAEEVINCRCVI